jgi:hypothetical protein
LRLDRPLAWKELNSRMCARGEAVVGNNTGRQLIVGMQICPGRPWAPASQCSGVPIKLEVRDDASPRLLRR